MAVCMLLVISVVWLNKNNLDEGFASDFESFYS